MKLRGTYDPNVSRSYGTTTTPVEFLRLRLGEWKHARSTLVDTATRAEAQLKEHDAQIEDLEKAIKLLED